MRRAVLFSLIFLLEYANGLLIFQNVTCQSLDKSFLEFEYCFVRSKNVTHQFFSIKVNLLKASVNDAFITVDVRKKSTDYKPFLYNFTFDACKFLRSKRRNPLHNYFYTFVENYSNMNHTCPYDHDIIIEMEAQKQFVLVSKILPFPNGEYGIFITFSAYNVRRACVNFFIAVT